MDSARSGVGAADTGVDSGYLSGGSSGSGNGGKAGGGAPKVDSWDEPTKPVAAKGE